MQESKDGFVVYIDESGDEGFRFDYGSSRWFVLGSVIIPRARELEVVKLIDNVRDTLNQHRPAQHQIPKKKPLHFRDLRHEARKYFAQQIAQAELQTVCVLINKTFINNSNFNQEQRLYFHAVRLLVERVSWCCHNQKAYLVFSNRSSLDYSNLCDYLKYLEENRKKLNYRAAPGVIDPDKMETFSAGKRLGLQLADAIASSYFYAVEPSPYGLTEEAYARILFPRAYRSENGEVWDYGIKLFPKEAVALQQAGKILTDLR
jgi:hypothetical protein